MPKIVTNNHALAETVWSAVVVRYFDRDGHVLDGVVVGHYSE